MKLLYRPVAAILICACTSGTYNANEGRLPSTGMGLKDYYQEYFPIGVALSPGSLRSKDSVLIKQEFNSVTAENVMKMGPIHPDEDRYDWEEADKLVDFAQRNKMRIRGHALCWHEQTPDWLFTDEEGDPVEKDVLLARLKTHITRVVGRYKGKIYAWDVVNEAIADDPDKLLRGSLWYRICGEEFISKAFEYAHEADPDALLFYNDYNADWPEKRDRIYAMLKGLIDRGVPIHGVGMQGHWSVSGPTDIDLRAALDKYALLGLDIQITELDMSVYPWEKNRRERRPGESDELTPEMEQLQYERYQSFFKIFREYEKSITGITFWGLSDAHTWLGNYPVEGRRNYPLLFDHERKKKRSYYSVVGFWNR